jgi:IclR family transcriptional regulator, acetate operon repressor
MTESTIAEIPRPAGASVQSVSRAMSILTAVAASPIGLTAKEISERLGLNRPTAYHLLRTLQQGAFLFRASDRRYRLDFRIGTLAEGFARHLSPDESLTEYARRLADETHEMTHVSVRRGAHVILLRNVEARHAVQTAPPFMGQLDDLHGRATGKAAMAWAAPETREEFLTSYPLRKCTPATITRRDALRRELERVRAQGYATTMEEVEPGVCSMAAPLDAGVSPFILALTAPRERFDANFERYLEALLATARAASSSSSAT